MGSRWATRLDYRGTARCLTLCLSRSRFRSRSRSLSVSLSALPLLPSPSPFPLPLPVSLSLLLRSSPSWAPNNPKETVKGCEVAAVRDAGLQANMTLRGESGVEVCASTWKLRK